MLIHRRNAPLEFEAEISRFSFEGADPIAPHRLWQSIHVKPFLVDQSRCWCHGSVASQPWVSIVPSCRDSVDLDAQLAKYPGPFFSVPGVSDETISVSLAQFAKLFHEGTLVNHRRGVRRVYGSQALTPLGLLLFLTRSFPGTLCDAFASPGHIRRLLR